MIAIYVSGKISDTTIARVKKNVDFARKYAERIWKLGKNVGVFCPHTNDEGMHERGVPYEQLMTYDFWMIDRCRAVFCLPNWKQSPGAMREVAFAIERGIPVFYSLAELEEWLYAIHCKG